MAYADKKILGIITARGGSKELPRKNILPLSNKPLIAWTIEQAQKSKYLDRLVLSTDCQEIKNISIQYSCEVPFIRPSELAHDSSTSADVVYHALSNLEEYDYFVLLQPTSPLRKHSDIDESIERCINMDAPSCVSICKTNDNPQLMFSIEDNFHFKPLLKLKDETITRRQDMDNYYKLNGAVYVVNVKFFNKSRKFIANDSIYYEMPKERSIDIDNEFDLSLTEFLLTRI